MVRGGFTFIELIIVIVIIGTMSVVGLNTFDNTRSRIIFFNDVSRIEDSLKLARSVAVSDKSVGSIIEQEAGDIQSLEGGVVAKFVFEGEEDQRFIRLEVYGVEDVNASDELDFNEEIHQRIAEVDFSENQHLLIEEIIPYSIDGSDFAPSDSIIDDFYIVFSNEGRCEFLTQVETNISAIEHILISIPLILTSREAPIRFLYMHKVACMPEVLLVDFFNPDGNED